MGITTPIGALSRPLFCLIADTVYMRHCQSSLLSQPIGISIGWQWHLTLWRCFSITRTAAWQRVSRQMPMRA